MAGFILSFTMLILYFIICVLTAILMRILFRPAAELFRKTLHFILLGSTFMFLYVFETWQGAVMAAIFFAVIVYPVLALAEHWRYYSDLLVERAGGEVKKSLLYVFAMIALVIAISWGIFGEKYIALAVIMAWGLGDAAALVGKRWGQHHIKSKYLDGKKTIEGTLAMFALSFLVITLILVMSSGLAWYYILIISLLTSALNTLVELYTKNGMDTVTCPLAVLALMLPLLYLLGALNG